MSETGDAEFERLFEEFHERLCRWVDEGLPYLSVLLSHEYFRFLYPIEPYADFVNDDPVAFIKEKLARLLASGEALAAAVHPYDATFLAGFDRPAAETSLEDATSDLYTSLWQRFDERTFVEESARLLAKRLGPEVIAEQVKGRSVLDMGCGSGRYSLALAAAGASRVVAVDLERASFAHASELARERSLPIDFKEANFHRLPEPDESIEFVFSNGTLHHSSSIRKGLEELRRVLVPEGRAFLYLYADGGIFWYSRRRLRELFQRIPRAYTRQVLLGIGLPPNRFIFEDVWHVPVEQHTSRAALEGMLGEVGLAFEKHVSSNEFDLDRAIRDGVKGAEVMWGDGEHRYLLRRQP